MYELRYISSKKTYLSWLNSIIMEYQKIANLLDNVSNQPSKFRTRNWVEINDESRGTYTSNDIKFKTTMLRSNLCDYADAYILVKETITITVQEMMMPQNEQMKKIRV